MTRTTNPRQERPRPQGAKPGAPMPKCTFFQELRYVPHAGQRLIHQARKRFVVAICGRRWGKTLACAREALYSALTPGARILVVAPYQRLTDRLFSRIWHDAVRLRKMPIESKSRSEYFIRFAWDSVIEARTAENPDNLVGEGYDLIIFDEAAKARPDVWEHYLAPSLMDKRGRAIFVSTPEGYNWLYELYLRVRRDVQMRGDWFAFVSPTRTNPHIQRSELILMQRLLSDFAYAQEVEARFMRNVNLVYPQFSIERHVKSLNYDPHLPLYRALDFGYINPFVCLTIQVAPNDEVRVLDEIYLRGQTLTELAEIMRDSLASYFEKFREYWQKPPVGRDFASYSSSGNAKGSRLNPQLSLSHPLTGAPRFPQSLSEFNEGILYFCDPAGAGERATLRELGFFTQAKHAPISLGIELIRRALGSSNLKTNNQQLTTGEAPRLFVSPSCVNLIREFTSYRYPQAPGFSRADVGAATGAKAFTHPPSRVHPPSTLTTEDQGTSDSAIPTGSSEPLTTAFSEIPLKTGDHALDALRYFFVNHYG